jgi:hypothetical protein
MTLETKDITTSIFVLAILLLAAAIAYAGYNYGHTNSTSTVVTITPTPVPIPTPNPSYLTNVVTVDSMTTSASFAQVNIREDNRIFDVPYSYYDELTPGDRVQFHVVSTYNPYGSVVYKVDYVTIISHYWSNTRYYYYNDKYWRDDDHVTIEVTWDEAYKHKYTNGKPERWYND